MMRLVYQGLLVDVARLWSSVDDGVCVCCLRGIGLTVCVCTHTLCCQQSIGYLA